MAKTCIINKESIIEYPTTINTIQFLWTGRTLLCLGVDYFTQRFIVEGYSTTNYTERVIRQTINIENEIVNLYPHKINFYVNKIKDEHFIHLGEVKLRYMRHYKFIPTMLHLNSILEYNFPCFNSYVKNFLLKYVVKNIGV